MGLWGAAPIVGSLVIGTLSDRLGGRAIILWTAYPNALVTLMNYRLLESPVPLGLGFTLFGFLNSTFPALVVALAQESAAPGAVGAASGIVMSLHYVSAVLAPVVTARLLAGGGETLWRMVAVTSIPLIVYASLVAAVRETRERPPGVL